jgi:hypothetical protein
VRSKGEKGEEGSRGAAVIRDLLSTQNQVQRKTGGQRSQATRDNSGVSRTA